MNQTILVFFVFFFILSCDDCQRSIQSLGACYRVKNVSGSPPGPWNFFNYCMDCEQGENYRECTPSINLLVNTLKNIAEQPNSCRDAYDKLNSMKNLDLENLGVSDIRPLAGFVLLTRLNLSNNSIQDLTPLYKLRNIESLTIDNNQISDLKPLASLESLNELDIENNNISDFSPVEHVPNVLGKENQTTE